VDLSTLLGDMAREILRTLPLEELALLARLAPTNQHFRDAYDKKRAAEEEWLAGVAVSAFGAESIRLLLNFVTAPVQNPGGPASERLEVFSLRDGQAWPDAATLFEGETILTGCRLPMYGGLEAKWCSCWDKDKSPQACWSLTLVSPDCGEVLVVWKGKGRICVGCMPNTAEELLACLGVVHLLTKRVGEVRGGARARWYNQGVLGRQELQVAQPEEFTRSDLESFPPDAQRAMIVLRENCLRFGSYTTPEFRPNSQVGVRR
jgi:hypothetical protein